MNLDGFRVITGNSRVKVTSVEFDSRKVTEGSLFVAVKGFTSDGHSYIKSALEKGASVIVADENDCPYTDEELKAMADEVTLSNNEDGIAVSLAKHFGV